jgi:hypothetical protein
VLKVKMDMAEFLQETTTVRLATTLTVLATLAALAALWSYFALFLCHGSS